MMSIRLRWLVAVFMVTMVLAASQPAEANQSFQGYYRGRTLMGRIIVAQPYVTEEFRVTAETKIVSSNPEHDDVSKLPKHSVVQVIHDGSTALAIIVVEVPQ